jgi:two-component system CheB/CheR fusion protein
MAFVVVQHLSPDHQSNLTQLLSRWTKMKVVTASDGTQVAQNAVYVLPPSAEIAIQGGVLHLRPLPPGDPGPRRHVIDAFLRSLAADQGPGAIGVVLSGGGSDGTLGLKAIKAEGGITFVQDPGTATQPGMPQSALDSGSADFCISPGEIGDELMRVSNHPYLARIRPPRKTSAESMHRLLSLLRKASGVDFTLYKHSTIERRIERRMALHRLERVEEYVRYVEGTPAELDVLYRDILIGVTSFFRDREMFAELRNVLLPRILEQRSPDQPVRIWSAGCSSGEEAYSLAICLLEALGDKAAQYKLQIFGTDLDDDAVRNARHGVYPKSIELDVSPERLQRFFSRTDGDYRISRNIRDMVIFATHDLGKDPPFSRLDLVCCRNVLIYMQPALQKKVLRIFHYALNPDGFLALGTSETVGDAADLFSLIDRKLKMFSKKNAPATALFELGFGHFSAEVEVERRGQVGRPLPMMTVQQLADRKVIEKYAPPGVVINDTLEVLQFRGRLGAYMDPTPGAATLNLLKLVRPELLVELRGTVHRALTENLPVTSAKIPVKQGKEITMVTIDALPLQDAQGRGKSLLVLFREVLPPVPPSEVTENETGDPRQLQLERELFTTKEYLQSVIEELEAANEELKSSNEELQSSNEELQSTNEELETSKEELQSTNEELATVNEELQNRMSELSRSNDDLQNILAAGQNAVLIVGMDLRLRRFSRAAEDLLGLISGDVGRPIGYLKSLTSSPNLEEMVTEAINSISVKLQEAKVDGAVHSMRITPYKTAEHAIRGAVIELSAQESPKRSKR